MKTKLIAIILALSIGTGAFTGCVTTGTGPTPATQKAIAKLAVQYAVLKVANNNPEKAAKAAAIAVQVKALAGGQGANTVDLLIAIVRVEVGKLNLKAEDALLADALVDLVAQELEARLGSGVLTSEKLLIVGEVAGWIVDAAALVPSNSPAT